jgi:hypothetical protein
LHLDRGKCQQGLRESRRIHQVLPVSSQVDPIQTLIAQIDRVLNGTDVSSAQTDEAQVQRQVLEQVRQYLAAQPTPIEPTLAESTSIEPTLAYASVEQSLQQFAQTLAAMHANLLGPLQIEIQALQRQRQDLIAEVRHLEYVREQQIAQRYQQLNPQALAADFWASFQVELHNRIGQSISQSLSQSLSQYMAPFVQQQAIAATTQQPANLLGDATHPAVLEPAQRLEYLQHVQASADRLLVELDSTIQLTFGTLQRNIQGYQESLCQQLDRMHHLEHQGEMLLATLVRHVAAAIEKPTEAAQLPAQPVFNPHPVDVHSTPTSTTMSIQPESQSTPSARSAADELDSALNFLNLEPSPTPPSPEETAAQIDRALSEAIEQSVPASPSSHPPSAEALENLYASLLESQSPPTPPSPHLAPPESPQPDSPRLEPRPLEAIAPTPDEQLDRTDEIDLPEPKIAIGDAPVAEHEISRVPDEAVLPPNNELETLVGEVTAEAAVETEVEVEPTAERSVEMSREMSRETPLETPLEVSVEPLAIASETPTPIETISALTDLLPESEWVTEPTPEEIQTWEVLQMNPDAPLEESEAYLQAPPDEDLLPNDEPLLEQEQNLQIDAVTMQKLEADLHSLEGLEGSAADESEPKDAELDAIFPGDLLREAEPPFEGTATVPPEPQERWYLGLDIGTTGISAALLNWETGTLYPIYWLRSDPFHNSEQAFRLPGAAWIDPGSEGGETVKAVGFEALALADENPEAREFLASNFTPCLNASVPWYEASDRWQPMVQWSQDREISLETLRNALGKLLQAIAQGTFTDADAAEMQPDNAQLNPSSALPKLSGAIVNASLSDSEAYRFNLREAVLKAGLVNRAEQIAFIEDGIATVLSALPGDPFASPSEPGWQFTPDRRGTTLAIDAGASRTELVLVNLPIDPTTLTYSNFQRHSFEYGGCAIDQDIICQLFLKAPILQADLGIPNTYIPRPGESDTIARISLRQWLESSPSGLSALELAQQVKVVLQEQEQFTFTWNDRPISVKRQDWESLVLLPYVQRLNRELNVLLSRTGVAVEGIERALCTGGNAAWEAIARWLRQKLPNATILQDVYPSHSLPACSRVACGLATLPLYPKILEESSQQYHDYFLLQELLQLLFDRPLSLADIVSQLEMRGIHALSCQPQIAAIVRGQLPAGLLPAQPTANWLTAAAQAHPIYRQLAQKPLFQEVGDRTYNLELEQALLLRQYLEQVTQNSLQTFAEPLPLTFSASAGLERA